MRITDDGQPATADFRTVYNADNLYLSYDVNDPTPRKKSGNGFQLLFKTGDDAVVPAKGLALRGAPAKLSLDFPVEFVGENNPPFPTLHSLPKASTGKPVLPNGSFNGLHAKNKFLAYQYRIRPLLPVWKFPRRRVRAGGVRPFLQC